MFGKELTPELRLHRAVVRVPDGDLSSPMWVTASPGGLSHPRW